MASHLDLEEQEQLDQLKHFWTRYGNAITWVLIVILAGVAAWNGYQYWQRTQAAQASALYDELERAAIAQDVQKIARVQEDLRAKYGRTTYAAQGSLLAAQLLSEKGNNDAATAALTWVINEGSDDGIKAVARLRLVSLQIEAKAYDDALKTLSTSVPREFEALAADRKGDVLALQGKADEAVVEYRKAYKSLDLRTEYRRLVEAKLNALGVDVKDGAATQNEDKK
ncbi:tetratricopeptide repeat protein [Curvibacter sp. RS43]|jgi:predicted negative regulator of RcsB-dependent stress response|uniref:Ancillary SecYEG translocon subunit n=1 Tax=Curvibacter microcysteis TaxID=3026419 RepID=A0ABT5MEA8_9BURK|nr:MULTISPECIES: tetratricopeptide repeat protein [unclassified Curvibacter]MDD0809733.1 tetratricopeptide repeat protein [Curvibacter sp. RS43]MDD0814910.1 tetratricopeptide repeat protein [Curvibacter sp. HBC28]